MILIKTQFEQELCEVAFDNLQMNSKLRFNNFVYMWFLTGFQNRLSYCYFYTFKVIHIVAMTMFKS